jgi:cysteine synthase
MCEKITNINANNEKIELIKKKIIRNKDNPKLIIEQIIFPNKKTINLVQDGYLISGTKQRVAVLFMKKILQKNKQIKTLLYSGTSNGFGAIATAYAAFKLGLKSKVFINGHDTNTNTRQINTLLALNAEVNLCPTYAEARDLKYSISDDKNNVNTHYNVPMGLNDENNIMTELLSRQITLAARKTILKNSEYTRIWLVGGSGGIAMSIHRAFPAAKLFILLTGAGSHKRKVIEWAKKTKNISLIKDLNLENTVTYYSSVKNYDDLIVPYVIKYGRNNDFIWNVSSDDYLFL